MAQEENEDVQVDEVVEQEEQTSEEADLDLSLDDLVSEEETVTVPKAEYTKIKRKAIAYDSNKSKVVVNTPEKKKEVSTSPQASVEETVLLVNGMPEELLNELKVVAQVRKVSFIKAQSDPIFVAVKEKFEKDKKQEGASMGASRGSGQAKPKKDFSTPGLSRDDHKALIESLN